MMMMMMMTMRHALPRPGRATMLLAVREGGRRAAATDVAAAAAAGPAASADATGASAVKYRWADKKHASGYRPVRQRRYKVKRSEARPLPQVEGEHLIRDALRLMREHAWARFDESVDVAVHLKRLDLRKPTHQIRGTVDLPAGTGRQVRIAVFARDDQAKAALAAGADVVGAEDLRETIRAGSANFDRVLATPDMMSVVGALGRILGPRGLMPSVKMGTVSANIAEAVTKAKAGQIVFRVDKDKVVHAKLGALSFSDEDLLRNIRAFMIALAQKRPEDLKKTFLETITLSSTMGCGIRVRPENLDPSSKMFMAETSDVTRL